MGLSGTKIFAWKTVKIPFDVALSTAENMINSSKSALKGGASADQAVVSRHPSHTVAIDANLIAYKYITDGSSISPVGAVLIIARAFIEKGWSVIIVADNPEKRHPSKRATCQRVSKQKKATIKAKIWRLELHSIQAMNDSTEKATQLEATMKKLTTAENAMSRIFPPTFSDALDISIQNYKQELGEDAFKVTFKVAPTQADPCVAKLVVDGSADAFVSNDGDFHMYIGTSGRDLMLKELQIVSKGNKVSTLRLQTSQQAVADEIESILNTKLGHSPFSSEGKMDGTVPTCPILNGVKDPIARALIAMMLGCDACPGGIPGIGPKKASDIFQKFRGKSGQQLHEELAAYMSKEKKALIKDPQAILCLCYSMVYEKTGTGVCDYVHGEPPNELTDFNKDFKGPDTTMIPGPSQLQCKENHPFLEAEGSTKCVQCHADVCRFCFMEAKELPGCNGKQKFCFECMNARVICDVEGEKIPQVPVQEMRTQLKAIGMDLPAKATNEEVITLFKQKEDGIHDHFELQIKGKVTMPMKPTKALHPSEEAFTRLKTVKVHDMDQFVLDKDEVSLQSVCAFIHILATFSSFEARPKGARLSYKYAMPTNVIEMANQCRIDKGHRLCSRAIRHSQDRGTPDVLLADLTLCIDDDVQTCLILDNKMLASMKGYTYAGQVAFDSNRLIAASCNCIAGRRNVIVGRLDESVAACTHAIGRMTQFGEVLYRDNGSMTHWVLKSLRTRLKNEEDGLPTLGEEEMKQLSEDITILIKSNLPSVKPVENDSQGTDVLGIIKKQLETFAASTDKQKSVSAEPRLRDLGLMRKKGKKFYTPELQVEEKRKGKATLVEEDDSHEIKNLPKGTASKEEYLQNEIAVDAVSLWYQRICDEKGIKKKKRDSKELPIGILVNKRRSEKPSDYVEYHPMVEEKLRKWREIFKKTGGRKRNRKRKQEGMTSGQVPVADEQIALALQKEWDCDLRLASLRSMKKQKRAEEHPVQKRKREPEEHPVKKRIRPKHSLPHHRCCFPGCTNHDMNSKLKLVKSFPRTKKEPKTDEQKRKLAAKKFIRRETTERLGYGRQKADSKNLHLCSHHEYETVHGKTTFYYTESKRVQFVIPPFSAPKASGKLKEKAKSQSKGSGVEREILGHAKRISLLDSDLSATAVHTIARETRQQLFLDESKKAELVSPPIEEQKVEHATITLEKLLRNKNDLVRSKTGFPDLLHLLKYSAITYGGDLDWMAESATKLDWLEELMMYYELTYGRSKHRIEDFVNDYNIGIHTFYKAIRYRLERELACRERWPMYCSYEEDANFRNPDKWDKLFKRNGGHRVVMHDTTNIPLWQPSAGDFQRALYNKYYGMCCAKAGVAAQLCNWIFGLPLVTGHSDDDQQIEQTKILELQKLFAEGDLSDDGKIMAFLNVFDKGYHQILEALKQGQFCLTPDKSTAIASDGASLIRAAAVAVLRSGNERAVLRTKLSALVRMGMHNGQGWDVDFICDVWEAWTFRCNFMYKGYQ